MLTESDIQRISDIYSKTNEKFLDDIKIWAKETFISKSDSEYLNLRVNIKVIYVCIVCVGVPVIYDIIKGVLK